MMKTQNMQAEIVTVGDELLSGRTENTNASFLSRELQEMQRLRRGLVTE